MIYHYTTLEGLKGIVETKKIWATAIRYLNDVSEMNLFIQYMHNWLSQNIQNPVYPAVFDERMAKIVYDGWEDYYAISCSTVDDNLTLWSEFSGRLGCEIAFDESSLIAWDRVDSNLEYIGMKNVTYNYIESVPELVQKFNQLNTETFKDKNIDQMLEDRNADDLYNDILKSSIYYKMHQFTPEQEVRLAFYAENRIGMKHRIRSGLIIPYIEIPIKLDSIKYVKINPYNKDGLIFMSLNNFFKDKEVAPDILQSNIALRYY